MIKHYSLYVFFMNLFHFFYPNQHYIHFGYFIINENVISEKREYALSPRVFSKNWEYSIKDLQNLYILLEIS